MSFPVADIITKYKLTMQDILLVRSGPDEGRRFFLHSRVLLRQLAEGGVSVRSPQHAAGRDLAAMALQSILTRLTAAFEAMSMKVKREREVEDVGVSDSECGLSQDHA